MSRQFSVQRGTTRIIFESGAIDRIRSEVSSLGRQRVAIVSTPGGRARALELEERLAPSAADVISIAKEHVPIECVTEAQSEISKCNADLVLAIGGGSAIGLAKAIALSTKLPIAVIPTT